MNAVWLNIFKCTRISRVKPVRIPRGSDINVTIDRRLVIFYIERGYRYCCRPINEKGFFTTRSASRKGTLALQKGIGVEVTSHISCMSVPGVHESALCTCTADKVSAWWCATNARNCGLAGAKPPSANWMDQQELSCFSVDVKTHLIYNKIHQFSNESPLEIDSKLLN